MDWIVLCEGGSTDGFPINFGLSFNALMDMILGTQSIVQSAMHSMRGRLHSQTFSDWQAGRLHTNQTYRGVCLKGFLPYMVVTTSTILQVVPYEIAFDG